MSAGGRLTGRALATGALFLLGSCMGDAAKETPPVGGVPIVSITAGDPKLGDTVTLQAATAGVLVDEYRWSVIDSADEPVTVTPRTANQDQVELKASLPGTYLVHCSATLADGSTSAAPPYSFLVRDPSAVERSYRVRITPPPSTALPTHEQMITMAGVDVLDTRTTIQNELSRSIEVMWGAAQSADTQLRIYSLGDAEVPLHDELLQGGRGTLKLPPAFRALFIPLGTVAAAKVLRVDDAASLTAGWPGKIASGTKVAGSVLAASGAPIAQAAVSLVVRSEGIRAPSTLAMTDVAGSFQVIAPAGINGELTVAPPAASGLPVAVVAPAPAATASSWQLKYSATLQPAELSAVLTRSDGSKPTAGAVVVVSRKDQPEVGKLVVDGKELSATGRFRYTLVSDAAGTLKELATGAASLPVPSGSYTFEVFPGKDELPDQGYAQVLHTVGGVRGPALKLQLGRRVTLSGTIAASASAQVLVTATAAGARRFGATVDGQGRFSFLVDDRSTYSVVARPRGVTGKRVAAHLDPSILVDGARSLAMVLPAALLYTGQVVDSSARPLAGCVVRVWCEDPSCPGRELIDETVTDAEGAYLLRFPAGERQP